MISYSLYQISCVIKKPKILQGRKAAQFFFCASSIAQSSERSIKIGENANNAEHIFQNTETTPEKKN